MNSSSSSTLPTLSEAIHYCLYKKNIIQMNIDHHPNLALLSMSTPCCSFFCCTKIFFEVITLPIKATGSIKIP